MGYSVRKWLRRAVAVIFSLLGLGVWVVRGQELDRISYPMGQYVAPLRGPLGLSGSFGEVRSRHFHAGTDLRTGGKEGKPVYAVAAGRVVRINVSTTGYGLALYVAHPNGSVSVYGHLQRFAPGLAKWVRQQLYAKRRHTMEIYPTEGWSVKAGEVIGYSGNTGSSGGPHLHFELRARGGQLPYNSVLSGIRYQDSMPPYFRRLYVYAIDTQAYEPSLLDRKERRVERLSRGVYAVRDTLELATVAGLGVEVRDTVNAQSLVCNACDLRMYVDENPHFTFNIDHIGFDETGYADAHIDYALYTQQRMRVHLLFRLPGNALSRSAARDGGLLRLDSGRVALVRVEARDALGNTSELHVPVRGGGRRVAYAVRDSARRVGWEEGAILEGESYRVRIAPRSLYYDLHVGVGSGWCDSSSFAPWVQVHHEGKALHRPLELAMRVRNLEKRMRSKLYVARWDAKRKRYGYYAPAVPVDEGLYGAKINDFGRYTLMLDTLKPVLDSKALDAICGQELTGQQDIRLRVRDGESSISSIDGTLDGRWMLWEYEPKTGVAFHRLEAGPSRAGMEHAMVLRVQDKLGNVATHQCSFIW